MSEKIRKLKEDASRLIAKGRVDEAADCYEKIVKADPRDLTARQKLAELYGRLGKVERAVHVYQSVAGSYAADGLLLKAIAVCKIILQLDPRHTETQAILADLSTKRRGGNDVVEMPKAMSEALPTGKKSAASIRGTSANQIRGASADDMRSRAIDLDDAPAAAAVAPAAALGVSASTSIEELGRVAASMLPLPTTTTTTAAPTPAPPAPRALPDDEAFDISFDDAEPVVVGAMSGPPSSASAPLLTAAFNAALPSFDELMAATPDVPAWRGQELTSADGPA
ncbi:MAG TPA: tetratricopeptide repeat protein, partial [Myxococcota bacterium]